MEHTEREQEIREVEILLAHIFTNRDYLEQALTHSSWANEQLAADAQVCEHNERLEFLGDAVLELCVSHILFQKYPSLREGALTKIRSYLVSTASLARLAKEIRLDHLLRLGHGEELQGGRTRSSVLSDTIEAVIAAVYLDGGFDAARRTVQKIFTAHWEEAVDALAPHKDHKTLLQERVQQRFKSMPLYTLIKSSGPEHAKVFTIELRLPDGSVFFADGPSYKKAEQQAAEEALRHLDNIGQEL